MLGPDATSLRTSESFFERQEVITALLKLWGENKSVLGMK